MHCSRRLLSIVSFPGSREEIADRIAPVLDRMDLSTSVKKVNGTLFPGPDPSIARMMPNPEADAIWDEFELTRTIAISEEEVRRLGKDPATVAQFEDSYWYVSCS
jgi:hypothetical protein